MTREEAIEEIKSWAIPSKKGREVLETLIPELAESEDEKFRRYILDCCEESIEADDRGLELSMSTTKKLKAWLEKQKEQKPGEQVDPADASWDAYYKRGLNKGYELGLEADRKEQKPVECEKYPESKSFEDEWKEYYNNSLVNRHPMPNKREIARHFFWFGQKQVEKPAEWGEDYRKEDLQTRFAFYTYKDEDNTLYLSNLFVEETSRNKGFGTKILAAAEKVAETIDASRICLKVKQDSPANTWYRKNGYAYMTYEDGYNWLEKKLEYLKPKQEWSEEDSRIWNNIWDVLDGPFQLSEEGYKEAAQWFKTHCPYGRAQSQAEWSEEDDMHRKWILECLAYGERKVPEYADQYHSAFNWFKSLRPQPRWKPSEEQMMKKAIEFECIGKKVKMTVQELINYYIDSECVDVAEECGF